MQQALMEAKSVEQPHRLTLDSRSRLSVTGVLEVESFDETEILLTSTRGPLSIRGQGLRLQQLSIDCLLYTSPSPRDRTRSRMPSSA